ncbi:MAG: maleylpyruvate isomerase family mycothiol-dependent enzyme [Mycobacteriales bacterium]
MTSTLPYAAMLELVAERSAALRSSVAGALDARIPGCPDWTGRDLVAHLGEVQRCWAANVAAGPAEGPADDVKEVEPTGDLLDSSEQSTETLLAALREAGPDRGTWVWWGEPALSGAVARHQVQEAMVHAWDADDAVGRAGELPRAAALDGVAEFLETGLPGAKWEHPPAAVGVVPTDGARAGRRVVLSGGERRLEAGDGTGDAVLRGSASDLVLALYRRRGIDSLSVTGDRELAERFLGCFGTD